MHSAVQIEFSSKGDAQLPVVLASKVGALTFQLRSFSEPLTEAVDRMREGIKEQFDVGGNPQWEPLRPSTVRRKGGDSRPLIRTGKLRRVAVQKNAWTINGSSATYTVPQNAYYGMFHQTGFEMTNFNAAKDDDRRLRTGKGKSQFVPARPFARVTEITKGGVEDIFDQWLVMRIARTMI